MCIPICWIQFLAQRGLAIALGLARRMPAVAAANAAATALVSFAAMTVFSVAGGLPAAGSEIASASANVARVPASVSDPAPFTSAVVAETNTVVAPVASLVPRLPMVARPMLASVVDCVVDGVACSAVASVAAAELPVRP